MVRIKQGIDFTLWGHTIGQAGYSVCRAPVRNLAEAFCWLCVSALGHPTPSTVTYNRTYPTESIVGGLLPGGGVTSNLYSTGGTTIWCVSQLVFIGESSYLR